ncbi:cubilin [Colletes latitarsis]|uniref:cubilin n=1 Tax=Colletes latitarsis TaxID=2605962 RepID=UPI004036EBE4
MGTRSQWLLLTYLGFCAAWMDERPVLESRDGSLFISAARDRNITLKILGNGYVNVNEINLLHVASAAQNATHLIERWRTGYLAEVESNLQRLTQIVEGPEGLQRRMAVLKGLGEANVTSQSWNGQASSDTQVNFKFRMLTNRVRRLQNKVASIEAKLKENNCISNPCQNGGTCQDLYEGYQCHCTSNWEGPNCVIDVNECVRLLGTDLGCQNGATCLNLPGSYKCNCASGWHGLHCTTKTSVCNTQNSDELCGHGVCVTKTESPLGYSCICDQGWQSDGTDPACVKDVNECAGNHRPCSVNPWVDCRNAPGSFFCDSCPRGYMGNGYYCNDIDECLEDNGGCSKSPWVQCINTMGSRMCGSCPTGYRGDGVTCIYVGGCAINNGGCHPYAKCVENPALTSDYVLCRCPAGYSGNGIGPNGCQPITDVSAGTACASNPCVHGRCVPGSIEQHYVCVCESGYTGLTCNDTINPCLPNPCQNNGVCTVVHGAVTCDCPATATGNRCETLRQTCGGVSRNSMGNLQFPVAGNIVYQHGLSCAWVVITNSSLVLNLTFTRFNLEDSTDCKFDFLQIHDGRNAGSQIIGRFCGNKLPNGNGTIISTHNTLYLWFHSDSSVSHDGFALHWNSIEPVCGGRLTDDYGTISSPGSPGRYPPNRDCFWSINVNPTKRIQFHFGQLMLEEHPTCQSDYLEIVGELDERLGLYCNHTRPPPLIAPGSEAMIHFHSDSAGQDSGFQIHYSTIEGIPGCSGVYTAPTGTISLPTHTSTYRENMECDWRIQMPHGERIQITWSKFELEDSTSCEFDYVKIFDGPTSDSPLLGRFCGTTIPPTIRSTSNALLVIFKSDWMLGMGGFTFAYNIICGGVFTASSGTFHSPMYPNSYHHSRICTYEIEQPAGMRIALSITDLDIEGINPPECFFDFLEIFDGDSENSANLATLCGNKENLIEPYYSTHNFMFLKFSTDGSVSGRGFMANYTTIPSRCGGLLKAPVGTIQSPVDDEKYLNYETCIWTIQAPPGYVVQIMWLTFDLEYHNECMNDYVKIYEYHTISEADLLGTFCGTKKPPIITSQGNSMTVRFETDSSVTRQGFVASYFFIDGSKVCGGHFIRLNGVIKSPNYPESYSNKRECTWVIEAPNRQKVILNVEDFELESHSTCIFDYLEIRNGGYDTSPLIGKFCGTDIPSQIISQTNQIYLKFVSDVSKMYKGFSIEWDSTTSGCGGTMIAASGDIISPNYPQQYLPNSYCTWKIHVASGSLVRLLIVDLNLESYSKCRFDYIEISEGEKQTNRQKYCGHPYPKVISANSNIMTIRFRSDFSTSERGFHLKYETICQNTLTGYYGVIESPNFPNKYERNLNCSWKIDAPRGNRLNLTFSHFDLEKPNDCRYDYVEVKEGEYDVPKTEIAKLCDSDSPPAKIHSTQHQVFVKFVTDGQWEGNGFRLEWAVDGCGGHLTRPSGQITSPGYPSGYPIDVDCRWLIEVDYTHSVELTIHDINTEKLRGCFFDKLAIYNGEDSTGLKLVEICYSENPVVFTSTGSKMFLEFHSDVSYAARGFNLTYRSVPIVCGGLFTADTGIIHSTNYPQNYPNNQLCEWLIRVDENYVVNVTFLEFDLEKTANCTDDYVKIYDGPTQDSPLMANLCRNILPPPFVSTANEMLIVMRTDGLLAAKGFKAEYARACGARLIVKDQGYLTPARSFTGNYEIVDNWNCTWTLIAEDPGDHVTVSFTHLEMIVSEVDPNDCWLSYIEIHEGTSMEGPSRGKWCGSVVPLPITSTGNALTVHLYVSGYDFHGHFALTYSVLNSACGGTYTSYPGVIASPGYPNSYPLNAECVWILENSPGNQLILTFKEFELQQSENCDLDYLEIREDSGIGKIINVLCGTDADTVRSSAKLWIKFKSDAETVAKGFVAEYTFQSGGDLSGPTGRITSPLYPIPYKQTDTITWRITVEFQWAIRIEISDLFVENSGSGCFKYLRIYDGYNNEAPVLLETCKFDKGQPVTTIGNVAFIELTSDFLRLGSWFDLTWLQVPKDENVLNTEIKLSNCTKEVALTSYSNVTYQFTSPGWPHGYDVNLDCTWVFTSVPGTHLILIILAMDLEESTNCVADALSVYDGNALTSTENAVLIQRLCLANSTLVEVKAGNVMTVKFESDVYINKTGFSAYVYWDCGGKLEGPNGVIEVMNKTFGRAAYTWRVSCEWDVVVKTGRTIEVIVEKISTVDNTKCTDYYMLKNGDKMSSSLLGKGKYCANDTLPTLMTSGNRLYVALTGQPNMNFKMKYREVGLTCGGEYVANNDLEISTPNYPNIPPPFTECKWTLLTPTKELISLDFIDRFDLLYTPNCVTEYVEIKDGGTEYSKLLGRFCGDVAPSTIKSTGNMLYIHYFSDIPEPKNGFNVKVTIGNICGGTIRGTKGVINSPNYPFYYPTNQTCVWRIIAPIDHSLKLEFRDIHLPGFLNCKRMDHVTISEPTMSNETDTEIGTYCGNKKPEIIETSSNEAIITFVSDTNDYRMSRGFSINFTSSIDICGGELTAMSGIIKSNGYPNVATSSRYCDWRIRLPKGYQVVVNILDMDVGVGNMPIHMSLSFYNDFRFRSRIKMLSQNDTMREIKSSSNTMMIGYSLHPGYRGFKLRYTGVAPAPCGREVKGVNGTLQPPSVRPFNESSYYCTWSIEAPKSMVAYGNDIGLTLSIRVTGFVGGMPSSIHQRICYNYQYIMLTDYAMVCGNYTEPTYLTSPKHLNELIVVNSTYGKPMKYDIQYRWQPCGGILKEPLNLIVTPKNVSYPVNCAWYVMSPDSGQTMQLSFKKMNMSASCTQSYISVKNGGPLSPEMGHYCGNAIPNSITSTANKLYIEYFSTGEPNEFEIEVGYTDNVCGGSRSANNRQISSPGFPKSYKNNEECTWEITAVNGYHVGLVFIDRFNLESSTDCQNDYVQIFDWRNGTNGIGWQSIGKVCGRTTPPAFNATSNRMKVTFHTNERIQGDGFRAQWYENCGGIFEVTNTAKIIESPGYPNLYRPNSFCNYTLVAPGENIIVEFMEFQLERGRRDCQFDNLTIITNSPFGGEEETYCSDNKPPILDSYDKTEIIFRSDKYIQRTGFAFKYILKGCGGNMTKPGKIKPLMKGDEYFPNLNCVWRIEAPPDKSVVLRFESFVLELVHSCVFDNVEIYDGEEINEDKRLGKLCGNLTENLPVFKSTNNTMVVQFYADRSRHYGGFTAEVLFVKSIAAGCGGSINLTTTSTYQFKTQKGSTYESLEDCHWDVTTHPSKNIRFTINSMDLKNNTYINNTKEYNGDYLEVRDGTGPFSELIGKYYGTRSSPLVVTSSGNSLWIRFFSDGTLEGTGVTGTFETIETICHYAHMITNDTKYELTSPNYPNNYEPSVRCRWQLENNMAYSEKVMIHFKDLDLPSSAKCEDSYLEISDSYNTKHTGEGFGKGLIWSGDGDGAMYMGSHLPTTSYRYCGHSVPGDYYSYSSIVDVTFKGDSAGAHKGFKIEYSSANCNRNYTTPQGRIVQEGGEDCWITVIAPVNYTISLYFNRFTLYDPNMCTQSSLKVYDGGFNDKLLAMLCGTEIPSPIFSTGNKLSLHSWSSWFSNFQLYDISFTTTDKGRGCGGRLYNYAGSFTSPMYPNEYRNNTICEWLVEVPSDMKVNLEFTVFDIGTSTNCKTKSNILMIYEVEQNGDKTLANTFCGGDNLQSFQTNTDRVMVQYISTVNNVGSGWVINFEGQPF